MFELFIQAFAIPRELRTIHSTVPGDALSRVSNLFTREVHCWCFIFNYFLWIVILDGAVIFYMTFQSHDYATTQCTWVTPTTLTTTSLTYLLLWTFLLIILVFTFLSAPKCTSPSLQIYVFQIGNSPSLYPMLHCSLIWGHERESWRYEIQLSLRGMGENILPLEGMKFYPRYESSIQLSQQFCCSLVVIENVTHMAKMLGWTCHPGGRVELCLILFLKYW